MFEIGDEVKLKDIAENKDMLGLNASKMIIEDLFYRNDVVHMLKIAFIDNGKITGNICWQPWRIERKTGGSL